MWLVAETEANRTMKRAKALIAYYRVSTKGQGPSGLGLEAQRADVAAYAASTGSTIAAEYTEVESGKHAARPELAKALARAKRAKGRLVVAKLERLSRNVSFTAALMESGVPFTACDLPEINELTMHIVAAVAQAEAKAISQRTKEALAAAKAHGTLLGSARPDHWRGREDRRRAGQAKATARAAEAVRQQSAEAYSDLLPVLVEYRAFGLSLRAIAAKLNAEGHTTRRGKPWNPMQVKRVLDRAAAEQVKGLR
jgi:DNA invertase Pin-like site-specific DNA recombinase